MYTLSGLGWGGGGGEGRAGTMSKLFCFPSERGSFLKGNSLPHPLASTSW